MLRDDLLRLIHPAPAELPWFQVISWVCDPREYATDSRFKTPFVDLYDKLLNHSIARMGAGDILTFPGRRFDGRFKGEQKSTTALFKEVLSGDYIVQRKWRKWRKCRSFYFIINGSRGEARPAQHPVDPVILSKALLCGLAN